MAMTKQMTMTFITTWYFGTFHSLDNLRDEMWSFVCSYVQCAGGGLIKCLNVQMFSWLDYWEIFMCYRNVWTFNCWNVKMFKCSNVLGAGLPEEQVCWANKSKSLQLLNSKIILSLVAWLFLLSKIKCQELVTRHKYSSKCLSVLCKCLYFYRSTTIDFNWYQNIHRNDDGEFCDRNTDNVMTKAHWDGSKCFKEPF